MAETDDTIEKRRAYQREKMRRWRAANPAKAEARRRDSFRKWEEANPERAKDVARKAKRKWEVNAYGTPKWAYRVHKKGAKKRGIPFLLTFDEWWSVWDTSGKWEQRGVKRGQYVMARTGDVGPYAIGNVRICTCTENMAEATALGAFRKRPRHGARSL